MYILIKRSFYFLFFLSLVTPCQLNRQLKENSFYFILRVTWKRIFSTFFSFSPSLLLYLKRKKQQQQLRHIHAFSFSVDSFEYAISFTLFLFSCSSWSALYDLFYCQIFLPVIQQHSSTRSMFEAGIFSSSSFFFFLFLIYFYCYFRTFFSYNQSFLGHLW